MTIESTSKTPRMQHCSWGCFFFFKGTFNLFSHHTVPIKKSPCWIGVTFQSKSIHLWKYSHVFIWLLYKKLCVWMPPLRITFPRLDYDVMTMSSWEESWKPSTKRKRTDEVLWISLENTGVTCRPMSMAVSLSLNQGKVWTAWATWRDPGDFGLDL